MAEIMWAKEGSGISWLFTSRLLSAPSLRHTVKSRYSASRRHENSHVNGMSRLLVIRHLGCEGDGKQIKCYIRRVKHKTVHDRYETIDVVFDCIQVI
ncbi:hypothetical protein ACFXTH_028384 [Malus domestica]